VAKKLPIVMCNQCRHCVDKEPAPFSHKAKCNNIFRKEIANRHSNIPEWCPLKDY